MDEVSEVKKISKQFFDFVEQENKLSKDIKEKEELVKKMEEGIKGYKETISHLNPDRIPEDADMEERLNARIKHLEEDRTKLTEQIKFINNKTQMERKAEGTIREKLEGTLEGKADATIKNLNEKKQELELKLREQRLKMNKTKIKIEEYFVNLGNPDKKSDEQIMDLYAVLNEQEKDEKALDAGIKQCDIEIEKIKGRVFPKEEKKVEKQKPKQTELGQTEPKQTELGQTEPEQTELGQTEPGQTEPGQTEPGQTEPEQTEPAYTFTPYDDESVQEEELTQEEVEDIKLIYYDGQTNTYQFTKANGETEKRETLKLRDRIKAFSALRKFNKRNQMKVSLKTLIKADPNISNYLLENNTENLEEYLMCLDLKEKPENFIINYNFTGIGKLGLIDKNLVVRDSRNNYEVSEVDEQLGLRSSKEETNGKDDPFYDWTPKQKKEFEEGTKQVQERAGNGEFEQTNTGRQEVHDNVK